MSLVTLLLIAIGVSADAFAVALGKGLQLRALRVRDALAIAVTFGLFQAIMPLLGWLLGTGLSDYVTGFDHWIAFGLLAVIGGKMIWEAFHDPDDRPDEPAGVPVRELLVLGVATSIDALAVGITFAFLDVSILGAVAAIGVTTFLVSLVGVVIGHQVGVRYRRPAELAGGLVLILIGGRILLDHLGAW